MAIRPGVISDHGGFIIFAVCGHCRFIGKADLVAFSCELFGEAAHRCTECIRCVFTSLQEGGVCLVDCCVLRINSDANFVMAIVLSHYCTLIFSLVHVHIEYAIIIHTFNVHGQH